MTAELDTLADITARVRADHISLMAALRRLDEVVKASDATPRLDAPWTHLAREMTAHMGYEDKVLLPALERLARGEDADEPDLLRLLQRMGNELDEVRTLSDAVRVAATELPQEEQDLLDLCDALEVHAVFEESDLFPAAMAAMGATQDADEGDQHTVNAPCHPNPAGPFEGEGWPRPVSHHRSRIRAGIRKLLSGLG